MNLLRFKHTIKWTGDIYIVSTHIDGKKEYEHIRNMIMLDGKNMVRDALKSSSPVDMKIKYCALGNSTTAVANTQHKLVNEMFRQQITQQTAGTDGVVNTVTYIAPFDATTFTTEEIGWFAGSTASSTKDSGVMVARVLYHRAKSSLESLTITRQDTLS